MVAKYELLDQVFVQGKKVKRSLSVLIGIVVAQYCTSEVLNI